MISISNLAFSYTGDRPYLFEDISIEFETGRFYLIQGRSGSGKSTLLRLLNRLEEPARGEIRFNRKPLSDYHPPLLRKKILYVQQTPVIIPGSIRENLLLPYSFHGNQERTPPDDATLSGLLADFFLPGDGVSQSAETLSVGQLQRICLIRGMLLAPDVLLLDEPTSALDNESARIVEQKAEAYCRESRKTVIMVSHREYHPEAIQPVFLRITDGKIQEA